MSQNHPDQYPYQPNPIDPNAATTQFTAPGPQQPAPRKKRNRKKWGGIAVGALIIAGVAGSLGDSGDETETTAASETFTTQAVADIPEPDTGAAELTDALVAPVSGAAEEDAIPAAPSEIDSIPREHTSALREAQAYDRMTDMSKQGLFDQLTSEYGGQFSAEAAQYAVDQIDADWNANALAQAETYQDMNLSPAGIHDQLTSEYGGQFTTEQADYALTNLNAGGQGQAAGASDGVPVEHTSALAQAETYAGMDMSKQGVHDQLASEYGGQFSADAAQYAIDNIQWDWNANALASARTYQEMNMSPAAIHDQLTSSYGGQFTVAEADHAIANL